MPGPERHVRGGKVPRRGHQRIYLINW